MKELKIEIPEGYEIDKEKSSFEKIVFKKKTEVNCWEDLKHVPGVYIAENSHIIPAPAGLVLPHNKNVFLNEKYAKSALALAQISQLLPYYVINVDWKSDKDKYCICRVKNKIEIIPWIQKYHVLAFNTEDEAERFLKHNEQLVKDFYML
jgi:hypothetical protein